MATTERRSLGLFRWQITAAGASEALAAAIETFRGLGAQRALAEAEALQGKWAPSDTAGLPAGLSRREAEVALWVARGLTDKAVAAKLFISRRTVDTHLRHIYGKAGLANRAALGTWVAEQQLAQRLAQ